jgi:hypothetical protein
MNCISHVGATFAHLVPLVALLPQEAVQTEKNQR